MPKENTRKRPFEAPVAKETNCILYRLIVRCHRAEKRQCVRWDWNADAENGLLY